MRFCTSVSFSAMVVTVCLKSSLTSIGPNPPKPRVSCLMLYLSMSMQLGFQFGSTVVFVSSLVVVVEVWVVRSVLFVSVAFTICGASRMPLTIAAMVITENKANVLFFPFMAFTSVFVFCFRFWWRVIKWFFKILSQFVPILFPIGSNFVQNCVGWLVVGGGTRLLCDCG